MEEYERYKEKHPDWNDEQIWTAVSMEKQADIVVKEAQGDIDVNDPELMDLIIHRAMDWLDEVMPWIYEKVKHVFANILSNIGNWIKQGFEYIMAMIGQAELYV